MAEDLKTKQWKKLVNMAELRQQEYYEMLPELTKYERAEYKYLRQNIGFAIFGPPMEVEGGAITVQDDCTMTDDHDVTHALKYSSEAIKIIDFVYEQVVKFGNGFVQKETIYYGQIFNIIFPTKDDLDITKSDAEIEQIPIFKVLRQIKYQKDQLSCEMWFIDGRGRVYKGWQDYLTNNTLPQCTMVVPMGGIYQPNTNYEISEKYSKVWTLVRYSAACGPIPKVLSAMDVASTVVGVLGIGVGIASLFTPAAPVAAGVMLSGVNGFWIFGRSAHHLRDRKSHKESISITNRNALCSWLAIGGSTLGVVSSGSTAMLTKFVKNGSTIPNVAKYAYNVIMLSNLSITCVGIAYQAFNLYQTYQEEERVRLIDVASVAAHVLFFGNAVLNLEFAGTLIKTTQGKVLDDYGATLRSKHSRKQFNRAKRNAAGNNADEMSVNAEVIRYINRKDDLNIKFNSGNISTLKNSANFNNGKIVINGIRLLEPMKFVDALIKFDKESPITRNHNSDLPLPMEDDIVTKYRFVELKDLLISLLENLSSKYDDERKLMPRVGEFYRTLNDVKFIENGPSTFVLLFKIGVKLLHSLAFKYLEKSVHFVWNYVKQSIQSTCSETCSIFDENVQKMINSSIMILFEHMEDTGRELKRAFEKYISENF